MKQLSDSIVEAVGSSVQEAVLQPLSLGSSAQNELLFFFKPECFLGTSAAQQSDIIHTAFRLFDDFATVPAGVVLFGGTQLAERKIMDRHYGFINQVSRSASSLSASELQTIKTQLGVEATTPILGGHEFLAINKSYDAVSLDALWATKKSQKLRGGLYFQAFDTKSGTVVLLNGFHPAQLAHFTAEGRKLVLVVLHSDLPWKTLRTSMLGDTFPERAAPGSFRRVLYDDPGRFGLSGVSIAANASHMSAGPFEAMFELSNFLSDGAIGNFDITRTRAWRTSEELGATVKLLLDSTNNPLAHIGGLERSLFDATEETDTLSACHLFRARWSRT